MIKLGPCSLLFLPNRIIRTTIFYTRDLVMLSLLYCSGINSAFVRKPQRILFFLKYFMLQILRLKKKKLTLLCKDKVLLYEAGMEIKKVRFSQFFSILMGFKLFLLPYCFITYSIVQIVHSSFPLVLQFQGNLAYKNTELSVLAKPPSNP